MDTYRAKINFPYHREELGAAEWLLVEVRGGCTAGLEACARRKGEAAALDCGWGGHGSGVAAAAHGKEGSWGLPRSGGSGIRRR